MRSTFGTPAPASIAAAQAMAESPGDHPLTDLPEEGLGYSGVPEHTVYQAGLSNGALHLDQLHQPKPLPMYKDPTDRSWYRHAAWTLLLLMATWLPASAQLAQRAPAQAHDEGHSHELDELLHKYEQRIEFTENKGQFGSGVLYRADFPYGQALATPHGMVIRTFDPEAIKTRQDEGMRIEQEMHDGKPARPLTWRERGHGWMMHFQGALPTMRIGTREAHPEVNNYFTGKGGTTDVRSYQEVWYNGVYENIDVRYYPAADGSLEYDVVCKPGSDPRKIAIEFKGIERLRVNEKGELVMPTSIGEMVYPAPIVYQRINGREKAVKAEYTITKNNVLGFTLGAYDKTQPLVIDPIAMRWATWVNTNSSGDNHGHCIWVDPSDGAIYVVARVVGTTDNITVGAFDTSANGNLEMIVGKYLEPTTVGGSGTRVWQTYIGGSGDDNPYAMEQGPDGNLYITGQTSSTNFPLIGGSAFGGSSVNQQAQGDIDVFVLKINTAGNSIKAAVVGGNGADDNFDVRLAANGDVFVCGSTTSTNLLTLNAGSGASNTNNGGSDVFLFRINQDLSSIVWMRNYGGSGADRGSIMLHDPATNNLFIGGNTASTNFPTVSPRQPTRGGSTAGFIQRLTGSGATTWSSYFSSSSGNDANLLCMEFNTTKNELYIGGVTEGLNTANITSGSFDTGHNGSNDFYVGRMTIDQTFLAGTYVGGTNNEVNMMGLNTDLNNDVYVFGYSNSTNFPVSASPNVPLQATNNGNNDKVFFKLKSDLSGLIFSTYYGGTADDYDPVGQRGIKFNDCRIYTIVTAQSNNVPLTQGALNTTKTSSTSRYEPGLVVWANPPDLLGNSITYQGTAICAGSIPGDITGSEPSYVLPTVVRNNAASAYPAFPAAATFQWQISQDSVNWSNIGGATSRDLLGTQIGVVNETTYIRRIIGGDACILAGAADQVVTVRLMSVSGTVTNAACTGTATGSISATADGQEPFTYAWSNGQTAQTATNLAAGSYSVTVTDANGCTASNTFEVAQPTTVNGTAQVTPATCGNNNGSATATGTGGTPGYTYLWSTGSTGATLSGVGAGEYSVTITDANNCAIEIPVTIGGTMKPDANAGGNSEITCANNGTVVLQGSSSVPGVQFAWSGPGIVSGQTSANVTVNATGTYTLTVTNPQTGCSNTAVASVLLNNTPPSASATGGTLTCAITSIQLQGSGNGSFAWTGPNGFTSALQNPTVTEAGTYNLTVTGANGCTSTASTEVILDSTAPGATAVGGTLTCAITSIQLQGSGNGSFAWTGPNGFTSALQNPTVTEAGSYEITVTGANGCTSTASTEVILNSTTPGATAVGGTLTCAITSIQLQGSGNGSFAWTGPNGFTSALQNPTVTGAGTYNLTVTGANGCTSTASTEVILDSTAPGATAVGGTLTCAITSIQLQGSGNGSFAWTGPNGFTSALQNPTVTEAGTYELTVTGTNGCTSRANAEVGLDTAIPGASANGGTLTCAITSIQLQATGNGSFAWTGPNGFTSALQNPTVTEAGTYEITVTGTNGCTSRANAEVGLDTDIPGASANGGTLTCAITSIQLQATGNGSFAWTGPNGFTSAMQNPTVTETGTYNLTVTGANGCTSTASTEVLMDSDVPSASAVGGTLTCAVTSIQLQGSGNGSFEWTGPNGFSSALQNPTVSVAGTYELTVTGANGCTSTASTEVLMDSDVPSASAVGGTLTCAITSVQLQGTGNGSFAWTGPNGFTSALQNPTVTEAGTYELTVTGANGCTSTASTEVTLDSTTPGATAVGGTLTCAITSIQLQATGNVSFAWTGPNGFTSALQNPTVTEAGTYELTVTGANGCTSTASTEVTLDSTAPGATAVGGTLTCAITSIQLLGTGNGSFAWTGPNGFSSALQNPTVSVAGTYDLTVTGANGCTSTTSTEVTLDSTAPGATAVGGTLTCAITSIQLQGSGNGTFAWTGPNGFTSALQNPTVTEAGTYELTVTGANGCTSTASTEVMMDSDVPSASAQGGTLTCATTSIQLQGSGNGSFAWTGPNGFSSAMQNPTVTEAGTYNLTVTGANGCTSTASTEVLMDSDVPSASAAGGTLTCAITSTQLQSTGNGSFAWTGPNGFSSALQNPTVTEAGTYELTVTGANGCTSTASTEVMMDNATPGATAVGGTLTCAITNIQLQAFGNGTFAWTGPNGFTSALQNPTVTEAGTYELTVTGANGCTSRANAEVGLDADIPGASANGGTLTCAITSIQLQGSGNGSFAWTGPNGFSSELQNPTVSVAGTYDLTVTGANGCTSTASTEVLMDSDVPSASAQGGTLTCATTSIQLQGTGNGSFAWTGPNGFSSELQNPTVSVAGTYDLTVTGANGCTSTASTEVLMDSDVPSASAQGGTLTCAITSLQLQGSGNGSFAWTGPNGFSIALQNPTVSVAGTYELTVTGANGCTSTASTEVLMDSDVPSASAVGGTLTCAITSIQLLGTGNGSFAWTGPNGFSSALQNPTVTEAGTYSLTVTGANGCTSTASTEVLMDSDVPSASALGGTLTCAITSIQLQGTGNGSFAWTGPNGFSSALQNPTVSVAGTYDLTVTGANGCTSTTSTEVTLDSTAPGATAVGGTLTCAITSIQLQGSGNGTFAWTGPNGFTSALQNPTVTEAGTYELTVTGANGCTSTASTEVLMDSDVPSASAVGGTLTCAITSTQLLGSGNGSFAWTGPNGFSSAMQNPTVTEAGTYNLTVTGSNGCTSAASTEVLMDSDVPSASAVGGTLTCAITSIQLLGTGNGSFAWTGPNGFSSALQNPTVTEAGTYNLTVTGSNGCTSAASTEVLMDSDVPSASAVGGTLTCAITSIQLLGTGNGSFAWTGPNGFSSALQNPTVSVAGTYELTVTGANGCTSTASTEVLMDSDVPSASALGGTLTCAITSIQLQGTGNGSFAWTGPNGFASALQNPTVTEAGTYELTVTGANGCTSTASTEVLMDSDVPSASAVGGTLTCAITSIQLLGTGNGSFAWTGPNGFSSALQNPTVSIAGAYNLTVMGENGCTATAVAIVSNDVTAPMVTAQGGVLPCEGGSVSLSVTTEIVNGSYLWTGPNGFTSTAANPIVSAHGSYGIIVTAANGCSGSDEIVVGREDCDDKCPALIASCPADITVDCGEDHSPEALGGMPIFRSGESSKKCPALKNSGWWDETISTCPYMIRRTFWAVDMDGNVDYCEQLITVMDEQGPVMMGLTTEGTTVNCDKSPDDVILPTVWAYDECSKEAMEATHTEDYVEGEVNGEYSIVHTWTANDLCGNSTTATWTVWVTCEKPTKEDGKNENESQLMQVTAGPNPFRDQCVITLVAKERGTAVVTITDLQGRRINEAYNGPVNAGEATRIAFSPDRIGTGTFLYRVQMNGEAVHGRMVHQP